MASSKAHLGLFSLLLFLLLFLGFIDASLGKKRAVSIPDDLDDVVDDEEDEAWREWGKKKAKEEEFKPPDFSKMNPMEIQAEMLKRHVGPAFGFVKLRLGISRTQEEITTTAMRWSKVLRTGSVEVKFMGVDLSTVMFTIERGQDIEELYFNCRPYNQTCVEQCMLKEFVLSQPEAYEMKIGEQTFRRPGDPPLEEVIEMLRKKNGDSTSDQQHPEDEL